MKGRRGWAAVALLLCAFALEAAGAGALSRRPHERKESLLKLSGGGRRAIADITRHLYDESYMVRRTAAYMLAEMGPRAGEPLKIALQNNDSFIRRIALSGLEKSGAVTAGHLELAVLDEDFFVRGEAVRILGAMMPGPSEAEALFERTIREAREGRRSFSEFPREMLKETFSMRLPADGWKFSLDAGDEGRGQGWYLEGHDDSGWEDIGIEKAWQGFGHDYVGVAWYRNSFRLPEEVARDGVEILFEGVDECGWVWINGEFAGEHDLGPQGWDVPFSIDATGLFRWGEENRITVRVMNTAHAGGIWRPVTVKAFRVKRPG